MLRRLIPYSYQKSFSPFYKSVFSRTGFCYSTVSEGNKLKCNESQNSSLPAEEICEKDYTINFEEEQTILQALKINLRCFWYDLPAWRGYGEGKFSTFRGVIFMANGFDRLYETVISKMPESSIYWKWMALLELTDKKEEEIIEVNRQAFMISIATNGILKKYKMSRGDFCLLLVERMLFYHSFSHDLSEVKDKSDLNDLRIVLPNLERNDIILLKVCESALKIINKN